MTFADSPDKVVILDRDGTIVVDRGYLADPEGLEFLPGACAGLRWLCERGFRLIVITNQSGVGRGLFAVDRVDAMHERLHSMVERVGAKLAKIYYCPHAPDAGCACRKPRLALMEQAAGELNFDPRRSVVIGDKASDVEFGQRAGARTILICAEAPQVPSGCSPTSSARTLLDAAQWVTRG